MDFKEAVDRLGGRVTHGRMADALGVSIATLRQARLAEEARAHRAPPNGWRPVLARLARERGKELYRLADELDGGSS